MIGRAPGKLVISGAYSVLEGAPAIVVAVDRYVIADAARRADLVTAEVAAAVDRGSLSRAPWFDASALRAPIPGGGSRKLGLGSSAAILVASLAAEAPPGSSDCDLRAAIFPAALAAHRAAQPAGSGIDVAASVFGGVLRAQRRSAADPDLRVTPHAFPEGLRVEVFASPVSASTADFLDRVRAFDRRDPARYRQLLDAARAGAEAAIAAPSIAALRLAIDAQIDALAALGDAAGAAIVTPEVASIRAAAAAEGAAFGPSGAGGGDIAIYLGPAASSARLRDLAAAQGLDRIDLAVGAHGATQEAP